MWPCILPCTAGSGHYALAETSEETSAIEHSPNSGQPVTRHFELQTGIRAGASYIYELECVRGIAILLVFAFHVYGVSMGDSAREPTLLNSFMIGGNTGVTLFFVLSGFLLSQPWLKVLVDGTARRPSIGRFYVARLLRVLPLYYFAVLLSVLVSGKWFVGLKAAVFGFVGFDIFPYSVVWWTLSTEVQFYLLLPLFCGAWLRARSLRYALLVALALWLYCYINFVLLAPNSGRGLSYAMTKSLFARLPAFLIGIAAAWVYLGSRDWWHARADGVCFRVASLLLGLVALVLLGTVLQSAAVMGDRVAEQTWHIHHSLEAALWALLMLSLLLGNPLGKAMLINRPLAITGKLSYSIYLNHVPILFYGIYPVRESLGQQAYVESAWFYLIPVAGLAASLVLAYITYKLIELPFLNLKHKLPA